MALFDAARQETVVRIVYDGPPSAGKTTNLHHLLDHLPRRVLRQFQSSDPVGERTQFFDWLEIPRVTIAGHDQKFRLQLVTVPGQRTLLQRRRLILATADAVVFVATSLPDELLLSRKMLREMITALPSEERRWAPIGLVLQANKQDCEGAIPAHEIRKQLGLRPTVPAVPARAIKNEGVFETFKLAVSLAVNRVQTLLNVERLRSSQTGPETSIDFYEALLRAEQQQAESARQLERELQGMAYPASATAVEIQPETLPGPHPGEVAVPSPLSEPGPAAKQAPDSSPPLVSESVSESIATVEPMVSAKVEPIEVATAAVSEFAPEVWPDAAPDVPAFGGTSTLPDAEPSDLPTASDLPNSDDWHAATSGLDHIPDTVFAADLAESQRLRRSSAADSRGELPAEVAAYAPPDEAASRTATVAGGFDEGFSPADRRSHSWSARDFDEPPAEPAIDAVPALSSDAASSSDTASSSDAALSSRGNAEFPTAESPEVRDFDSGLTALGDWADESDNPQPPDFGGQPSAGAGSQDILPFHTGASDPSPWVEADADLATLEYAGDDTVDVPRPVPPFTEPVAGPAWSATVETSADPPTIARPLQTLRESATQKTWEEKSESKEPPQDFRGHEFTEREPAPAVEAAASLHEPAAEVPEAETSERVVPTPAILASAGPESDESVRLRDTDREWPPLPGATAEAGHVWPPVTARAVLAAVHYLPTSSESETWVERDEEIDFFGKPGWRLTTRRRDWHFRDRGEGRQILLQFARGLARLTTMLPQGKAIVLAPDGMGSRLWVISPVVMTLRQQLQQVHRERLPEFLRVVADAEAVFQRLRAVAQSEKVGLHLTLDTLARGPQGPLYLGLVEAEADPNSLESFRDEILGLVEDRPPFAQALRNAWS